ncbi:Fe-S cluster-binding ribosome biosynthesis protein [Coemansia javaensis]|uniref:Translation initiation factor RLI1 n=1 Tax=Coemansia javaensis TaxID=2761396 RepID=A0A9W8HEZ8_9FUNG|nr:Fe-S cluster-binding ribosome biosynthesis protein [Coemansia javaensis]
MAENLTRVALVDGDKCKPKKCRQECKSACPVNKMGKLCVEATPKSKIAVISEELCIGCNMCVKRCPFGAIKIINLPTNLARDITHRYGANSFKLHRLPMPRPGQVLGLVGANGTGKSTALKVLSNRLKPNLGRFNDPPDWEEVIRYFRGSELQNYFKKVLEDELRVLTKPQYVDTLPHAVKGQVHALLTAKASRGNLEQLIRDLDLQNLLERQVDQMSGGELQRFAIGMVGVQDAGVYLIDEPSSYLDVKQRIKAANVIRGLLDASKYVVVVEHDLAVLDYLSDFICILYGRPSAYGVVTMPYGVREGINIFLGGMIPTENMRFREVELTFRMLGQAEEEVIERYHDYDYPAMTKTLGDFKLTVEPGSFSDSQIIVLLGENGTGKTTLVRLLARSLKPDNEDVEIPDLHVSYKPQKIAPKFKGTVRMLLMSKIRDIFNHPQFQSDVVKPMNIDDVLDQEVQKLSGGELQRVALVLALGTPADVYLIDEPSAYLDSDQRIIASKVIKRFIMHAQKTAFIVEHDFIMATYLADRVIVMDGVPSVDARANTPESLLTGMNRFLRALDITIRRDPTNFRPRINKFESAKDREQKADGNYFFLEE